MKFSGWKGAAGQSENTYARAGQSADRGEAFVLDVAGSEAEIVIREGGGLLDEVSGSVPNRLP